ncbi:MAG TPA: MBL fold metallo-hydrolase [Syntrophorhabdaceae bacterium]|nr:MBL fold metallo-hydrolase [Syntrophorhabdaceae bacterium]
MKARFWGTRGSLPAAADTLDVRAKLVEALMASRGHVFRNERDIDDFVDRELPFTGRGYYGTNTACVQIEGGTEYVLCDAGTGIRDFSNHLAAGDNAGDTDGRPKLFNIFLSHLHWDHIQGFPFFMPAYAEGSRIVVHGCHPGMRSAFSYQQEHADIPLTLRADISYEMLEPGWEYDIAGFHVRTITQNHPGDSFGYRFEKAGKSIVYSTDCEHFEDSAGDDYRFLDFFRDADLLIIDAQYELGAAGLAKENWGHSSNIVAVELGVRSGVRRLCLFHNEPTIDDAALTGFLEGTRRYRTLYDEGSGMTVDLAYDGLEINI